jgi:hypothetical protein
MSLTLPLRAISVYKIIQQWYFDFDNIPTSDQLLLVDNATLRATLIQYADIFRKRQQDDDVFIPAFAPMLVTSMKTARSAVNDALKVILAEYHLLVDRHLTVNTSTIEGAGLGLFATRNIGAGEVVCCYSGLVHNFKSKNELQDQSYMLYLRYNQVFDEDIFIDAKEITEIKGRYINDPLNVDLWNVEWDSSAKFKDTLQCAVLAIKDISIGDELFISYGKEYWLNSKINGTVKE